MENKKPFAAPELEIVSLSVTDIITSSVMINPGDKDWTKPY